jgi:hypothetical protein
MVTKTGTGTSSGHHVGDRIRWSSDVTTRVGTHVPPASAQGTNSVPKVRMSGQSIDSWCALDYVSVRLRGPSLLREHHLQRIEAPPPTYLKGLNGEEITRRCGYRCWNGRSRACCRPPASRCCAESLWRHRSHCRGFPCVPDRDPSDLCRDFRSRRSRIRPPARGGSDCRHRGGPQLDRDRKDGRTVMRGALEQHFSMLRSCCTRLRGPNQHLTCSPNVRTKY